MKRSVGQFILFFSLVAIFAGWRAFDNFVSNELRKELTQAATRLNWHLEVKEIEPSLPLDVTIRDLSLLLPTPQFPLPLHIVEIVLHPRLIPLLWLNAHVPGTASLYGGTIDLSANQALTSGALELNAEGAAIDLSKHPLLRGFGVSGIASFQANMTGNTSLRPPIDNGSWQLSVHDGAYRGGYKLRGLVVLPAIKSFRGSGKGRIEQQKLIVEQSSVQSSIGTASARGSVALRPGPPLGNLEIKIRLNEIGAKAFNGYLALAANEPVDTPVRSWRLEITMNGRGYPVVRAEPNE